MIMFAKEQNVESEASNELEFNGSSFNLTKKKLITVIEFLFYFDKKFI